MAKIYLDSGDTFTLSGAASVFGSTGTEKLIVNSGATGVVADQNVERVDLAGASSAYTFQQSGNQLKVFSGTTLVATIPVQDDTDGTQVVFSNGSVSVKVAATGMTLGGATVPSAAAAAVTPTTIDATVTSGSGSSTGTTTTGQAFSLTSNSTPDALVLTTGNDTVTGAAGTLASTDLVIDSSTTDSDTLNLAMNGYVSTTATITNVETINATGTYASVGLDLANVTGTKTLKLAAGVSGATATVANAAATKAAAVVTADNVSILGFSTAATGTGSNVDVTAGAAASTVSITGGAGGDTVTLNAVANSTLTLDGGTGTDAFTVNLTGGANGLTVTAGTIETLTLNSKTAANTITMANTAALAGVATGNKVTVGGDQALTLKGNLDFVAGAARTSGVAIEKAAGAGAVTLQHSTGTLTSAPSFFNRAAVDTINVTATTGANITINEATTLKLSVNNGTRAYDVDNASTTAITAGGGSLKLDLTGTSATAAVQDSVTTGAGVGTLVITNNTIDSTLTVLNTNATATTVDTVVVSGSKDLNIGTWTATTNELLTASSLTGKLTVTVGANAATVVGGSSNDSITGGGAADNLRGGAGNDTINGGAFADTLTGGTGDDRFVIANGATIDTISDFSISGTNGADVIAFSIGDTSTLSVPKDGSGTTAITAGTVAKVVHVAAAKSLVAGENVIVIDGTFSSSAAMKVAIESGGSRALTLAGAPSANDDLIIVWTDGTNGHVGGYNLATTATTPTSAGTYTELVTLTGITDVTTVATANFLFLA